MTRNMPIAWNIKLYNKFQCLMALVGNTGYSGLTFMLISCFFSVMLTCSLCKEPQRSYSYNFCCGAIWEEPLCQLLDKGRCVTTKGYKQGVLSNRESQGSEGEI